MQCWSSWLGRSVHLGPLVGARGFGTTCLRRMWTLQAWTQVDMMRVWLSEEILPVDEGTGVFCIMCVIFFMCESLEGMCTVCVCGEMWLQWHQHATWYSFQLWCSHAFHLVRALGHIHIPLGRCIPSLPSEGAA